MTDATKPPPNFSFAEMLTELDGGVFEQKVARALQDVATGVVAHGDKGKSGKVIVTFDMKRIGETNQVDVQHKVEYLQPTRRGKRSEQDATSTPMHVGRGGKLTLMPDTQTRFDFEQSKD